LVYKRRKKAMRFGRIDGTAKRLNRAKMSPAQKNSLWSELNKEHCRRMKKLKLMTGAGRAVLPICPLPVLLSTVKY